MQQNPNHYVIRGSSDHFEVYTKARLIYTATILLECHVGGDVYRTSYMKLPHNSGEYTSKHADELIVLVKDPIAN